MAVGFAVNENLSISFSEEEDKQYTGATADAEMTIQFIQGAYTMGGLTIALAMDDIENTGYVADKDEKENYVNVYFCVLINKLNNIKKAGELSPAFFLLKIKLPKS